MLALHVVPNICDGFVLEGLAECADTHRAVAANKLVKILQADKCMVGREACKTVQFNLSIVKNTAKY